MPHSVRYALSATFTVFLCTTLTLLGKSVGSGSHGECAFLYFDDGFTLGLGQAAPDSVWFVHRERVAAAQVQYWAGLADRFRPGLAAGPGRATLAVRMEEERAVHASAGAIQLPVPHIRVGPWKPAGIRHRDRLLVGTAVAPVLHSVQCQR